MSFTTSQRQVDAANSFRRLLSDILPGLLPDFSMVDKVKAALREVTQRYRSGLSQASRRYRSDWNEAANRCAYVFVYLIQHCNLVVYTLTKAALEMRAVPDAWKDEYPLKVCCVGGGPGSDVVGLATFLEQSFDYPPELDCLILDLYPHWKRTWDAIARCLPRKHQVRYEKCDLVNATGLGADVAQFVREADLITMVKSFSAVAAFLRADRRQGATLRAILREMKPGCRLLYIDNDHDGDSQFRNDFADPAGLELVFEERGFQSVPSGSYSDTVRRYCSALGFDPMRGCDVNIQLYRKKVPMKKPDIINHTYRHYKPMHETNPCCDAIVGLFLCLIGLILFIAFWGGIGYAVYSLILYIL